jgi:hypothetical protein
VKSDVVIERTLDHLSRFGSRHGLVPCAKATKLATVRGVYFSCNCAVMEPSLVLKIAYNPGFKAGGFCATPSEMKSCVERVNAMHRVARECPIKESIDRFHCSTNGHLSSRMLGPGCGVVRDSRIHSAGNRLRARTPAEPTNR